MHFTRFLITVLFISISQFAFSQEQKLKSDKQVTKMHYYSFQGQASPEQLEFLQQDLKSMEFVTEVKIEYKAEKAGGQVRLIATENAVAGEGDKQFNAVNIKRSLVAKGLTPVEYHNETITNP
jgi:hypothetical protein